MTRKDCKRIFFTMFAALTVSGFIVICSLGRTVHRHKVETGRAAAAETEHHGMYTVREYNGKIAVFRTGMSGPCKTLDIDPALLSDYDRLQLAEGVYIENDEALRVYIQDISS